MNFPTLFTPLKIRDLEIPNRIFSTGHDTYLPEDNLPSDALIAYQAARAKGGVGLIIIQVVGVHETARYTDGLLMGTEDHCIAYFRRLIGPLKAEGTRVFVQLFHPGRELFGRPEGVLQTAYAPSATPSERFHVVPRVLSAKLIAEIISGYAQAARRMAEAGADGVEIVASHGYLPAQFISQTINYRQDRYGGSFENRLRFTREVITACRKQIPSSMVVGLRYSVFDADQSGMHEDDTIQVCSALAGELDYLNVIAGASFSTSSAIHIVPPMTIENAYLGSAAGRLKQLVDIPVFVAGRINQPDQAEALIASGQADMCGMTRAMICDPNMPYKAKSGNSQKIRACIGCNQACIGHFQQGLPISCIQRPETGRELLYGVPKRAKQSRKVVIVGGGVAGMKAAITAATCGHQVTLCEADTYLGGQARIAQVLPGRSEFGGIITNLTHELKQHDIETRLNTKLTVATIVEGAYDSVIVATGSKLAMPNIEITGNMPIVHAATLLATNPHVGNNVVIYDWRGQWTGVGVAELLATRGCHVRLAVNGPCAADGLQNYLRDQSNARLFRLGVEILPHMRLFGVDDDTAYFLHTTAQTPVEVKNTDTLILDWPNQANDDLYQELQDAAVSVHLIGDALSARTCEEAIFEGLKAGHAIS